MSQQKTVYFNKKQTLVYFLLPKYIIMQVPDVYKKFKAKAGHHSLPRQAVHQGCFNAQVANAVLIYIL
jgi:hypothetical protein